jgi:hypothetical protein
MDRLTNIFSHLRKKEDRPDQQVAQGPFVDQSSLPVEKVELINRIAQEGISYLEKKLSNEQERITILQKLEESVDGVLQILDALTNETSQYVFTGGSSDISKLLLASSKKLSQHPKIKRALSTSLQLNRTENMAFNKSSRFPGVQDDAIVIDEYAQNMMKATSVLASGYSRKKLVVFALYEEKDISNRRSLSDITVYHDTGKFFWGQRDSQLAEFLNIWSKLKSFVTGIKSKSPVYKGGPNLDAHWNPEILSPEMAVTVKEAEVMCNRIEALVAIGSEELKKMS